MISKQIKGRKDGRSSALDSLRYGEGLKIDRETGEYLDKSHRTRLGGFGIVDNGIYSDYGINAMSEIIGHAAIEMQANCDLNSKVGADKKIAHFVFSFDQDRPSDAALRDTEDSTLAALGLKGNHFATFLHNDNGYWHLHMFVSRIGKDEPHNGNSLWRDRQLRDKVCREVEIRHGLKRDNGMHEISIAGVIVEIPLAERRERRKAKAEAAPKISDAAQKTEIYSGEQTFQSWVNSIRVGDRLKHAKSWGELHAAAAEYGCEVKSKSGGFVLCPTGQGGAIQLSKVGLKGLPSKFGAFQSAMPAQGIVPVQAYKPGPSHEAGGAHFDEWKKARDAFKPIKVDHQNEQRQAHKVRRKEMRAQHKAELDQVRAMHSGQARFAAISVAKMNHVVQLAALTDQFRIDRQALTAALSTEGPGSTFRDYLVKRAGAGDEDALTLTRQYGAADMNKVLHVEQSHTLWLVAAVTGHDDLRMRRPSIPHRIERNGTVVFDLGQGRIVTDSAFGKQIQLNDLAAGDAGAIETSLRFAMARFGGTLALTGSIEFQRLAVETAVRRGLPIKFADPSLEQYRRELDQAKRARSSGPIDLSHLKPSQIAKGVERVLRKSLDGGVPPQHILRAQQHRGAPASPEARSLHELSNGGLDGNRRDRSVLSNPLQGSVDVEHARQDQAVRHTRADKSGGRGDRTTESERISVDANCVAASDDGLRPTARVSDTSKGLAQLHRDRRGLKGAEPVPIPAPSVALPIAAPSAQTWADDWAKEHNRVVKDPVAGRGDIAYKVLNVAADGIVLDLGRSVAVHEVPSGVQLSVGMRVVIDENSQIRMPTEIDGGIGKGKGRRGR